MTKDEQFDNFLDLMDAAEQGDRSAHASLSRAVLLNIYDNEKVRKKIQEYFRGAKNGSVRNAVQAAICLEYGICFPRDLPQAEKLLTKVIESPEGDQNKENIKTNAEYILAVFLLSGRRGSPTKFGFRATELLASAAKKNHALAQCRLGFCYQTGLGVTKSLTTAMSLYKESVRNGDGEACERLADIYAMAKEGAAVGHSNMGRAFKGYQLAVCRGVGKNAEVKLASLEAKAVRREETKEGRLCVFEDATQAVLNTKHPLVAKLFSPAP